MTLAGSLLSFELYPGEPISTKALILLSPFLRRLGRFYAPDLAKTDIALTASPFPTTGKGTHEIMWSLFGGRSRIRTYDFHRVKVALYR